MLADCRVDDVPEPYKTRIKVWRRTERICRGLPDCLTPTIKITAKSLTPQIEIWPLDSLVAAKKLISSGSKRVAVLNMADPGTPGGCVSTGSQAQEESLFRRTDLSRHLKWEMYPLAADELLYSTGVTVFLSPEDESYKQLRIPFQIDVISCPGIRHPTLTNENCLKPEDADLQMQKIQLICSVASAHDVDSLVLGALSCGAFKAPAACVANCFEKVLSRGSFGKRVVFAVLPQAQVQYFDKSSTVSSDNNLAAFQQCFKDL